MNTNNILQLINFLIDKKSGSYYQKFIHTTIKF